jgi:hypothetical protein
MKVMATFATLEALGGSSMVLTLESDVSEPKSQKNTPVRISDEAIKWARIASGYTGESMPSGFMRKLRPTLSQPKAKGRSDPFRQFACAAVVLN